MHCHMVYHQITVANQLANKRYYLKIRKIPGGIVRPGDATVDHGQQQGAALL